LKPRATPHHMQRTRGVEDEGAQAVLGVEEGVHVLQKGGAAGVGCEQGGVDAGPPPPIVQRACSSVSRGRRLAAHLASKRPLDA